MHIQYLIQLLDLMNVSKASVSEISVKLMYFTPSKINTVKANGKVCLM